MLTCNFFCFRWPVRTVSFNKTGEFIASASEDPFVDIVIFFLIRCVYCMVISYKPLLSTVNMVSYILTGY
jgi:hypothetical protein